MNLFILCTKIFIARIIDVSLATFVTILTVKNKKLIATIIGFIDVIIWFLVVKEALNTTNSSIWIALSYASGYAIGTYIGTTLSHILISGKVLVQVVVNGSLESKIDEIRNKGYAISQVNAKGKNNTDKLMLFIEVDKKNVDELSSIIKKIDEHAFIIVNETKYVENGFFK